MNNEITLGILFIFLLWIIIAYWLAKKKINNAYNEYLKKEELSKRNKKI